MTRHTIGELSPALGVQREIAARVVFLSPVRRWSNANGRGHVINAELVDAEGTRIRACAFNNEAKNISTILRGDNVYLFCGGRIRKASRDFNNLSHPYEIILSSSASVTPIDEDENIDHVEYMFTTIQDLVHAEEHAPVDVLAMILHVGDIDSVVDRNGGVQTKRELKLADASNIEITFTLWNEFAEVDYTPALYQPFAIRQAVVRDFHGRTLTTRSSTMIVPNPKVHGVDALQEWFEETHGCITVPISFVDCEFTPIKDVMTKPNGTFVNVTGVIVRVHEQEEVESTDGRYLKKRTVVLQDMTDTEMECTLWQHEATKITSEQEGHVLSLEKAKVVIYGKCRIATSMATVVLIDPAIPKCFDLAAWYRTHHNSTEPMSERAVAETKQSQCDTASQESGVPSADGRSLSIESWYPSPDTVYTNPTTPAVKTNKRDKPPDTEHANHIIPPMKTDKHDKPECATAQGSKRKRSKT